MELEGKIIQELPMQSGTSKAGNPWKKREWVLETFGSYPRKVKFHVFGDRADSMRIEPGKNYSLSFDLESREFNGRWYTDVSVYAARELQPEGAPSYAPGYGGEPNMGYGQPQGGFNPGGAPGFGAPSVGGPAAPNFTAPAGGDEDLPF
ncbi:MAG: DUF3127 domain-containing protein [Bacteroides sp.]|nr:DUF3127 domain-containing protein [Bacteroides sp.]